MFVELAVVRKGRAPHRVDFAFSPDQIPLDPTETSVRLTRKVEGFCELTLLAEDQVRVRGKVKTELTASCGRCLNAFSSPVEKRFDLFYAPDPEVERKDEISLKYDDLELGFYRDDRIDIRNVVMEAVFADLPMKMVCHPDCKGLCPQCGADRNKTTCECRPPVDARWQALSEFKTKFKG